LEIYRNVSNLRNHGVLAAQLVLCLQMVQIQLLLDIPQLAVAQVVRLV
jgi:hypothetical protein